MLKASRTHVAIPPGETIKELLEDRQMTPEELAFRTNIPGDRLNRILSGQERLSPKYAVKLEPVLGLPASFWNRIEAIYRDNIKRVEAENSL